MLLPCVAPPAPGCMVVPLHLSFSLQGPSIMIHTRAKFLRSVSFCARVGSKSWCELCLRHELGYGRSVVGSGRCRGSEPPPRASPARAAVALGGGREGRLRDCRHRIVPRGGLVPSPSNLRALPGSALPHAHAGAGGGGVWRLLGRLRWGQRRCRRPRLGSRHCGREAAQGSPGPSEPRRNASDVGRGRAPRRSRTSFYP